MSSVFNFRATAWIVGVLIAATTAWAAVPRLTLEALREKAVHVVAGEVVEVFKADGPLTIQLRVSSVSKGPNLEKGAVIEIKSWSASLSKTRLPPGPQGLSPIPEPGDQVIVYLGGNLKPLLPNGFVIKPR